MPDIPDNEPPSLGLVIIPYLHIVQQGHCLYGVQEACDCIARKQGFGVAPKWKEWDLNLTKLAMDKNTDTHRNVTLISPPTLLINIGALLQPAK